jgi:hypothetical protein
VARQRAHRTVRPAGPSVDNSIRYAVVHDGQTISIGLHQARRPRVRIGPMARRSDRAATLTGVR